MDSEISIVSSNTDVLEILKMYNHNFPRSIESRVGNLELYAEKLAKRACFYVAKNNDQILGAVIFYANDYLSKTAYLSHIVVSSEHQNKGIGNLLLRLSLELSIQNGMSQMKLEVDNSNYKAIAYYKKYNFIKSGYASLDSHYMIKELVKECLIG